MFASPVMPALHAAPCAEPPDLTAYDGKKYPTRLYVSSSSDIILLDLKPISHRVTNYSDIRFDLFLKPQVQHIVQEYFLKYRAEIKVVFLQESFVY
jgi:hypothetical protein